LILVVTNASFHCRMIPALDKRWPLPRRNRRAILPELGRGNTRSGFTVPSIGTLLFRAGFRRRRGYCRERVDVVFLTGVDLHRERALQAQTGPLDPLADAIAAEALGDAA
jgi:hypothetical protein